MNEKQAQELNYLRGEVKSLNAELAELKAAASRAAEEQAAEAAERLTSLTASYEVSIPKIQSAKMSKDMSNSC